MKKILKNRMVFHLFSFFCVSIMISSSALISAESSSMNRVVKIKVDGGITVSVWPDRTYMAANVFLKSNGNPVRKQVVKVEQQLTRERRNGYYHKHIKNFQPSQGKIVRVSITPPKSGNLLPGITYKIDGRARIGKLNEIISPVANSRITLAGKNGLKVKWVQNLNNVICLVNVMIGENILGQVFKGTVSGRSITIPASVFKSNTKYAICIISKIEDFSFAGNYLPGSKLSLKQNISTYFFTERVN